MQDHCHLSQKIGYQLYATFGAFYMPLIVMIVIYVRIFAVSKRIAEAEARSKPSTAHSNAATGRAPVGQRLSNSNADVLRRQSEYIPSNTSKNSLQVGR